MAQDRHLIISVAQLGEPPLLLILLETVRRPLLPSADTTRKPAPFPVAGFFFSDSLRNSSKAPQPAPSGLSMKGQRLLDSTLCGLRTESLDALRRAST